VSQERNAKELSPEEILASIKQAVARDGMARTGDRDGLVRGDDDRASAERSECAAVPLEAADFREDLPEQATQFVNGGGSATIKASFAALEKTYRCEASRDDSGKKESMGLIATALRLRALSEIEKDLLAAEARFSDAEGRRRQAEVDARLALEEIDKYQSEIDAAVDLLRRASPLGSSWSRNSFVAANVLTLDNEVAVPKDEGLASYRFRNLATD